MAQDPLIRAALDCGADKAVLIGQDAIVTDPVFRSLCEANRCGAYGRCWMCPPAVGPVEELIKKLRSYPHALFYQSITHLEDSFDIEGMQAGKKFFNGIGQKLLDACRPLLGPDTLHLSGGGCGLCKTCAQADGEPCRFPDRALSSLEAYGIDVYNTSKHTELKYVNGPDTVTYFGMVLFRERRDG